MASIRLESSSGTKSRLFYRFSQRAAFLFFKIFFGLKIKGVENVPAQGAFILASNHQSMFDPPLVGSCCPREVFFAAKKELFKIPLVGLMIRACNAVPVQRTGYDRRVLAILSKALQQGYGVTIFPEGTRFLDGNLHRPRPGVGMLAVRQKVQVVPVYVSGSNVLGRHFFKRGLTITFGQIFAIDSEVLALESPKQSYRQAAEEIMVKIALTGGVESPISESQNSKEPD